MKIDLSTIEEFKGKFIQTGIFYVKLEDSQDYPLGFTLVFDSKEEAESRAISRTRLLSLLLRTLDCLKTDPEFKT